MSESDKFIEELIKNQELAQKLFQQLQKNQWLMEEITRLKEENKLLREMLTAAGRLALSADILLGDNVYNLGGNILHLSSNLREYNQLVIANSEIIKLLNKS